MAQPGDLKTSLDYFAPMGRRAIIPLITANKTSPHGPNGNIPDCRNLQGDVFLFSKDAQCFIFFRISDAIQFRKSLCSFSPTTAADVVNNLCAIREGKVKGQRVGLLQQQIGFTRAGLNFLGLTQETGDNRFDKFCMRDDADKLGDRGKWLPVFDKPKQSEVAGFDQQVLHGVVNVATSDIGKCLEQIELFRQQFNGAVDILDVIQGKQRPGAARGHEHFGFLDGISQPAMRGLVCPSPGQTEVDVGVIITGYPGDPARDKRPEWAKDGTFMVFRQLEQDVLGFEEYCKENGKRWKEFVPPALLAEGQSLTDEQGAQLWAARMIGRWASGAPLAKCPVLDCPELSGDNDFDYTVPSIGLSDQYCPFTAHTRKSNPRNLGPYLDKKFLESSCIIRAGIPYGEEVSSDERAAAGCHEIVSTSAPSSSPPPSRGLLFVCYQSNVDSGFMRQTLHFANNEYFPPVSLHPKAHGQDPILGSSNDEYSVSIKLIKGNQPPIEIKGFAERQRSSSDPPGVPPRFFVTSRGGEYFFIPSISTIQNLRAPEEDLSRHSCQIS